MNQVQAEKPKFESDFRLYLQSELARRCKRNPRYSLRAFAEFLKMDASSVSQILSGKRNASTKVIKHITSALGTHPEQRDVFLERNKYKRHAPPILANQSDFALIAKDSFSFMSEWYHYAILEFISVDGFQNRPAWIARALGISASDASGAIERMKRLGIVREENGALFKTHQFVTNFEPGTTSTALKSLQRELISKSLLAIDEVAQEEKDITSITMAIDVRKLPAARKLIAKFRRDLCAFLEEGRQTQVYNLGIQLHPLSKKFELERGSE